MSISARQRQTYRVKTGTAFDVIKNFIGGTLNQAPSKLKTFFPE
jgi:hypothetical protein